MSPQPPPIAVPPPIRASTDAKPSESPPQTPPSLDEPADTLPIRQPVHEYTSRQSRSHAGFYFPRKPRWTARLIYWGTFLWMLSMFMCLGLHPIWGLAAFVWLIPIIGGTVSRLIVPFLIQNFSCPGCGEVYECVNVWNCSCGYHDHREQHILRFKCPQCAAIIGRTNCARCGATILLW